MCDFNIKFQPSPVFQNGLTPANTFTKKYINFSPSPPCHVRSPPPSSNKLWFDGQSMTEEANLSARPCNFLCQIKLTLAYCICAIVLLLTVSLIFLYIVSYGLHEDERTLALITLLSSCCDGDNMVLLWNSKFIWRIHVPCVNWIWNKMEPTHWST